MNEINYIYVIFNCTYKNCDNEYNEKWTSIIPDEKLYSYKRDKNVLADYIGFSNYNQNSGYWEADHRNDVIVNFNVQQITENQFDVLQKFNI